MIGRITYISSTVGPVFFKEWRMPDLLVFDDEGINILPSFLLFAYSTAGILCEDIVAARLKYNPHC